MQTTKVAVIGAGPVGLLASLLLEKCSVDFRCFERSLKLRSHPSAHWVSARSKQILSQIPALCENIDKKQQRFQNFKYYRYCETIGGREFGKTNHFYPSVQEKLQSSYRFFGQYPNHLSQTKLLFEQFEALRQKEKIFFDQNISNIIQKDSKCQLINQKQQIVCQSKYVILANGFSSKLRESIGITMNEGKQFYKLVNIHFKSLRLAEEIQRGDHCAMLHFIYNDRIPCVLVNHSLKQGEFVMQIPNYQPFIDLLSVYSPLQLLKTAISSQIIYKVQKDIEIIHVGRWKLQAQIANAMHTGNVFLAGDTAHTYTPAGGFGMNCGFQDVNQLVHMISLIERNPKGDKEKIVQLYGTSRKMANQRYLKKSLENYELTEKTAGELGFPSKLTSYFFSFLRMAERFPFQFGMNLSENVRLMAMKGLYRPKLIEPQLELFFDEFDSKVQRMSKIMPTIIEDVQNNRFYDLYVSPKIAKEKIKEIVGQIQQENICYMALPEGESIVKRDGMVLY